MSKAKNIELILLLLIASLAGACGGYFAGKRATAADPPIMVIDIQKFIDEAIVDEEGKLHPEKVSEGVKKAEETAQLIAERGYLVLQKQAVIAAPQGYFFGQVTEEKVEEK